MMTALAASTSIVAMLGATMSFAQSMDELIAGARAEGRLTTIALPHDWCGYGDVIAGFREMYPFLEINELNSDAGSADELEAVRANRGNTGPQAPDWMSVWPLARRRRPKGCWRPTACRPGIRSPTRPRMPRATGTAITTA